MLVFKLDGIKPLSNATYFMDKLAERANFKGSPSKFSITLVPKHFPRYVMTLQIMPQLFAQYLCDQIHCCNFSFESLSMTFLDMERNGFISLIFSLAEDQNHAALEFTDLDQTPSSVVLTTVPSQEENVGKIDYSFFVSLDLQVFKRIIRGLNADQVHVTLTQSGIKFSIPNKHIIINKEGKQCIIGGVEATDEIKFLITITPLEFFFSLTLERLWLFKSIESNGIIFTAPVGLHAEISSFFPASF